MIAHLVLMRAASHLTADDRRRFVGALERALTGIPLIRRATVGRRTHTGATYATGEAPYDYLAVLEFDTDADLRAYLAHPAHADLSRAFGAATETAIVADFTIVDGSRLRDLVDTPPLP